MPDHGGPSIFVSYAHEDKLGAASLVARLRACGLEATIDEHAIHFGDDIRDRVRGLIRDHTHLVFYLTHTSVASTWVGFEIGVATGLGREVVAYLAEPGVRAPDFVSNVRHVREDEVERFGGDLLRSHEAKLLKQMDVVQRAAREKLYYFSDWFVGAVRLIGADDEYWTEADVEVTYDSTPLPALPEFIDAKAETLERLGKQAREHNAPFFNGPNARLRDWISSPRDGEFAAGEHSHLELQLGPVGWHDYEGLNGAFRESLERTTSPELYERYLKLSEIVSVGKVSKSRLSNILDVAVTIVSIDGKVGYQVRKRVAIEPGRLTSAVAENINRYLDDADPADSRRPMRRLPEPGHERVPVEPDYRPLGVPHPFATARRGIAEELSPSLLPYLTARNSIRLLGLSFDLASLHPDALFLVVLPLTADEILKACFENPGKDYSEGQLGFTAAHFGEPETRDLLRHRQWTPGGMAAFVRALQFLKSLQVKHGLTIEGVVGHLLASAGDPRA